MKRLILLALILNGVWGFAGTTLQETGGINRLLVHASLGQETINPEIYGHFAEHLGHCIYEGFWVGEDSDIPNVRGIRTDVVAALKKLDIPVLRWPGGCFADEYHWQEGIGPREQRPKMVNTHWGMVTETNAFGTHEFLDLCEMLGCEAYIAGNVGSGTPEEMQDWVEYMTFAGDSEMANLRRANGRDKPWIIKYFGIGNENWSCGGSMTPEYYSNLYRRFKTYVRSYSGNEIRKVACGPGGIDHHWTEVVMREIGNRMDALSLHYYVPGTGGSAVEFNEDEWLALMESSLGLEKVLARTREIMDVYDPDGKIALYVDEWGTWWDEEPGSQKSLLYQQNTLRDAVSAGIFLNLFNQNCGRVKMANIAQVNNVLQAMILTDGEKMILTPTYHVFEMYKVHQGATLLPFDLITNAWTRNDEKFPVLNVSASRDENGVVHISLCNLDPQTPAQLECALDGIKATSVTGRVLSAENMNSHNTFDKPDNLQPGQLKNSEIKDGKLMVILPAKSVVVMEVK